MALPHLSQSDLEATLRDHLTDTSNEAVPRSVANYLRELKLPDTLDRDSWQCLQMLWPPRVVAAQRAHRLVPFFGAGVSIGSGLPSWTNLLSEHFGLSRDVLEDVEVSGDALTLAELASQRLGPEAVQSILRKTYGRGYKPSASHLLLAALRCPIYVTTNYDLMFEKAWEAVNEKQSLKVITNDLDLARHDVEIEELIRRRHTSVLLKIHGSADREDEHMILSRRDYRHHYRNNTRFFETVTQLLHQRHVLFLGFSHRDPEVSRLVDDAIYEFERTHRGARFGRARADATDVRPNLYSLQFDMRSHSPEVFAARGLVALQPPVARADVEDARSSALCVALADLAVAADRDTHAFMSLDDTLTRMAGEISKELSDALEALKSREKQAVDFLRTDNPDAEPSHKPTCLKGAAADIGALAGQGVYLLNELGRVRDVDTPRGISRASRLSRTDFSQRPYFREAKTFQRGFVSNSARSVFNQNSTVFVCLPLVAKKRFHGLLFSAAQIGVWKTPYQHAQELSRRGDSVDFILLDATGVLLLPPRNEFQPSPYAESESGNDPKANLGYPYTHLLTLSRRDRLVDHLANNIVPLAQDDDLVSLGPELRQYSVVTEIQNTAWKLALSRAMIKT